jgi:hypothetical protein
LVHARASFDKEAQAPNEQEWREEGLMSNEGYIKLHRKVLEKGWLKNPKLWSFWCYCLMKATHQEHDQIIGHQVIHLLPGQFIFGLNQASKDLNQSIQSIRTHINFCSKVEQNLTIQPTNKYSIITIVNWDTYQSKEIIDNNQTNKQLTNNQQTTNKQLTTNKNVKNKRNIYTVAFESFWTAYPRKEGVSKTKAFDAWKNLNGHTPELIPVIMAALERQKQTIWGSKEEKYIPHPATWLNQKRWEGQGHVQQPEVRFTLTHDEIERMRNE